VDCMLPIERAAAGAMVTMSRDAGIRRARAAAVPFVQFLR
jgi:hypothetical protein